MTLPGGYAQTGLTTEMNLSIAAGASDTYTAGDPRQGFPSAWVQVQNATFFDLSIAVGADMWTVTASQVSTIPLPPNGAGITVTANNNTANLHTGGVTLIWGLEGQDTPQPDGPLTGPNSGSGGGGGITELTSTDSSVTITDPTGPITDLSVSAGVVASFTYPMTWAVQGTILVPTGAVGFLPPSFVPVYTGLTATLVKVRYVCRAGSVDFDVTQNGTGVVSTLTATTTPTTTTVSVALADGDALAPVVTSIVSGPADGLTVTLVVELS